MKFIHRLGAEESGQALTEYALLMGFLLFASVAFAAGYTKSIAGVTNAVNSDLTASASSAACQPGSNCDPIQPTTVSRKIWSQVN